MPTPFTLQDQLDSLETSQLQKFFAWWIPFSTPVMAYYPQNGCDAPATGVFIGAVSGGVLLSVGMHLGIAVAAPPMVFAGLFATFVTHQLRENNRDVALAKKEIKHHTNFFSSSASSVSKGDFKEQALDFFEKEVILEKYSKTNILSLILKHKDKDTKIALLEACLGNPALGDKQVGALAKRFWKQEGFFACHEKQGTLAKIQEHLNALKGNEKQSSADYSRNGRIAALSLNRR